jgi:hydroxymethylglutaryl-CoA reductase
MARASIFRFDDIRDAVRFLGAVPDFFDTLKYHAEKTSSRAKLLSLIPHIIGSCVHVRFEYSTGQATGQNMTTIATHAACKALLASDIKGEYRITGFLTEDQFASDKKLAWGNVSTPRGVQVMARATIPNAVCKSVLGNDTSALYGTYLHGVQAGIRNGIHGYNINTANVLAAMFIATGQDAGSILEGGWAQLTFEYNDETEDLTASVFFPSLPVGTVGGGTGYSTQHEALVLLGCVGEGSKWKLAETIASFALALEISTISAIANDTFTQGHRRFARAMI